MSRRKRKTRTPDYAQKHHRLPASRGGLNDPYNISYVCAKKHRAFHMLFGNMDAIEVAEYLSLYWTDPDYQLVAIPKEALRDAMQKLPRACWPGVVPRLLQ